MANVTLNSEPQQFFCHEKLVWSHFDRQHHPHLCSHIIRVRCSYATRCSQRASTSLPMTATAAVVACCCCLLPPLLVPLSKLRAEQVDRSVLQTLTVWQLRLQKSVLFDEKRKCVCDCVRVMGREKERKIAIKKEIEREKGQIEEVRGKDAKREIG